MYKMVYGKDQESGYWKGKKRDSVTKEKIGNFFRDKQKLNKEVRKYV